MDTISQRSIQGPRTKLRLKYGVLRDEKAKNKPPAVTGAKLSVSGRIWSITGGLKLHEKNQNGLPSLVTRFMTNYDSSGSIFARGVT